MMMPLLLIMIRRRGDDDAVGDLITGINERYSMTHLQVWPPRWQQTLMLLQMAGALRWECAAGTFVC